MTASRVSKSTFFETENWSCNPRIQNRYSDIYTCILSIGLYDLEYRPSMVRITNQTHPFESFLLISLLELSLLEGGSSMKLLIVMWSGLLGNFSALLWDVWNNSWKTNFDIDFSYYLFRKNIAIIKNRHRIEAIVRGALCRNGLQEEHSLISPKNRNYIKNETFFSFSYAEEGLQPT